LWLKKQKLEDVIDRSMASYFEQVIDVMVYELYLEDILKEAGKDILQFLQDLPELSKNTDFEETITLIRKIYHELYEPDTPVRKRVYYIDSVPEVRTIEGKEVH
jgi:hypothetical protein